MSKNKHFPKVKLFGKKQIERWAGPHFLCIDARLHLLYCISWPNYYTLLHTKMQNCICCHSQQPNSWKNCDFHFITIRSLAHGLGNARFSGRTYFSSFTSCQLVAKVALAGLLSLWSPSAWAPPPPALRHHHPRHRPQHVKHLQDDQHWHHLWHQSYSGQGGESAQERIIDMIGSSLHFRRWSYK